MSAAPALPRAARVSALAAAAAAAMLAVAAMLSALAAVSTIGTQTAAATVGGGGELDDPGLGVGLIVFDPGGEGTGHWPGGDRNGPPPVYYRAVPQGGHGGGDLSGLCVSRSGPPLTEYPLGNGWWFAILAYARVDGAFLGGDVVCVPLERDGRPGRPVLPEPPSIAVIWDAVGLPEPGLAISPRRAGITGLATWVWSRPEPTQRVAVTIDDFRVSGTARVTGYGAFVSGVGWVHRDDAGSRAHPLLRHTFERSGPVRSAVATYWRGSVTMTGPGLAGVPVDLGVAVVRNGRDYPVHQIRVARTADRSG